MRDMHKLAVDVTFTEMTAKKGIKKHGEIVVAAIYKEYTQLEYMKVMGALNPERLTISQNYQEDTTIENDGPEMMIVDEDMEQPEEIENIKIREKSNQEI